MLAHVEAILLILKDVLYDLLLKVTSKQILCAKQRILKQTMFLSLNFNLKDSGFVMDLCGIKLTS